MPSSGISVPCPKRGRGPGRHLDRDVIDWGVGEPKTAAAALGMPPRQRFVDGSASTRSACSIQSSRRSLTSSAINPSPKLSCALRISITLLPPVLIFASPSPSPEAASAPAPADGFTTSSISSTGSRSRPADGRIDSPSSDAHGLHHPRRTRLSTVRSIRRPAHVRPRQPALRAFRTDRYSVSTLSNPRGISSGSIIRFMTYPVRHWPACIHTHVAACADAQEMETRFPLLFARACCVTNGR
jgi:hypothetical protein